MEASKTWNMKALEKEYFKTEISSEFVCKD